MSLNPGTRLGLYEILSPLGAGGMGEVYKARDTRLDRTVAIKVLPDALSGDPERRTRFEREAKFLASLNHPNVATLYGFDTHGDVSFLAMELVPGDTLAERIRRGPIPLGEVLPMFIQLALGLEAAHGNGVIHRDLKPANIKMTPEGKIKILDFGLAKAFAPASAESPDFSNSPTITAAATVQGEILGTAGYMSPEQARGLDLDRRTDIWAFGCVFYEALTGLSPFRAETITDTLAAIVGADPGWDRLPADVPPPLRKVLRRCLEKDVNRRLHDIADARIELEEILSGDGVDEAGAEAGPAMSGPAKNRPLWTITLPTALLAALATLLVTSLLRRPTPREAGPAQRFVAVEAALTARSRPALSPDGKTVVYSVEVDANRQLYRRALDSFDAVPIPGTDGGRGPFFSPDGNWVGFATEEALKKVPLIGGTATTLCNVEGVSSGEWGSDGTIVFALLSGGWDGQTALGRVGEMGGRPEPFLLLDKDTQERETWVPEGLPGDRALLYSAQTRAGWNVMAAFPDGTRRPLIKDAFLARWSPEGYLVYVDDKTQVIMAAPFDPERVEILGTAIPLTEKVNQWYDFDLAPGGTLAYVPADESVDRTVAIVDRAGAVTPILETPGNWVEPRVSPDGRRVLIRRMAENCDLWIYDLDRNVFSRMTHEGDNHNPVWAPDGLRIAVSRQAEESRSLVILAADGSTGPVHIGKDDLALQPFSWSRDGHTLVCTSTFPGTRTDIWTIPASGEGAAAVFLQTKFHETDPDLSPDQSWMAYASDESGRYEIYVKAFPGPGPRIQVSTDGGRFPAWSRSGRELFFVADTNMMVIDVEPGEEPRIGTPRVLFQRMEEAPSRRYDILPDGKTFVVARSLKEASDLKQIRVIHNWTADMGQMGAGAAGH